MKKPIPAKPTEPEPRITLRLDGGFVVAKCGTALTVYEILWQNRHGDPHKQLVLRECKEVPRQFEREAYPQRR